LTVSSSFYPFANYSLNLSFSRRNWAIAYSLYANTYSLYANTYSLCADLSYSSLSAFSSYLSITLVSGTDELALTY